MTNESLHACAFCPKAFPASRDLRRHILVHTGERPYKCDQCERRFARSDNMRLHIRNVHYGERTWLKNQAQRKKKNLFVAPHPMSKTNVPQYQCEKCLKMFSSVRSLNMHMAVHAVNAFACNQCGKQFSHKGTLNLHVAQHAREQSEHHNCQQCSQRFFKLENLQSHMLIHDVESMDRKEIPTPVKKYSSAPLRDGNYVKRSYECGTCKKQFCDQRKLAIHIAVQTHLGKMPFLCSHCKRSFSSMAGLKRHNTTVHKRKNDNLYEKRQKRSGNRGAYFISRGSRNLNLMGQIDRITRAHSSEVAEIRKLIPNSKSQSPRAERKSKACRNFKSQTVSAESGEDLKELISGILKANTGRNLKEHVSKNLKKTNAPRANGRIHGKYNGDTDRNGNFKAQANRNLKSHFAGPLKVQNGRNIAAKTNGVKSHFAGSMKVPSPYVEEVKNLNGINAKTSDIETSSTGRPHKIKAAPPSPEEQFKCKQCEKSFPFKGLLKRHAKIHIQEKPVVGGSQSQSSPAKSEVVPPASNGETQIECEHCGKHFSLQSYFDLHCKIMHRDLVKAV